MAGDLIPPPSPAGAPDPDGGRDQAQAVAEAQAPPAPEELVLAARPDDPGHAAGPVPPKRSRYSRRFGFVTGILAGLAVIAIVAAVLLVGRDAPREPAASWSGWKPTSGNRLVRTTEIAQYVGREYRMNDGSQLVDVEAGPLALDGVPLTPVVRTAAKGGDVIPVYGNGILYVLNGLGKDGSIAHEKPSPKRLALVEREVLELALYTFRYVKDVDHVVAVLPPNPKSTSGEGTSLTSGKPVPTLLLRPGDLRARLEAPLALTFPQAPPRPATMTDAEQAGIDALLTPHLFEGQVVPNQAGQGFLVLVPPAIASANDRVLQSTIPGSK